MSERTIIKKIETRVTFTNEEIIDILQKAAGAPDDVKGVLYTNDDTFYYDIEVVWWETKTEVGK